MFSKRGLSDIVTAVLVILLVLVAIGIIWAFLRPTINQGAGQLEGVTTTYGTLLSIESSSITIDEGQEIISFVVQRAAGEGNMVGISVVLEDSARNAKVSRDSSVLAPLETKRISVDYTGLGLSGRPTKVSVVPIFAISGGQERLGTVSNVVAVPTSRGSGQQCSNDIREGTELCDGTDLAGQDCTDFNSPSGSPFYFATTLSCAGTCDAFVTSACTGWCGDGSRNGPEVCEGSQFDPAQDQCSEIAAPSGYGNYYSGTPTCTTACALNTGSCTGFCGNTLIETNPSGAQEECDRTVFTRTCLGIVVPGANERGHFYTGTFKTSDCTVSACRINTAIAGCFDVGNGQWCGDGIKQSIFGEDCDGTAGCTSICTTDTGIIPKQCSDGLDNDGDGWIDFKGIRGQFTQFGDPGCSSTLDNIEGDVQGLGRCANGIDDDGDGRTDGTDFGCRDNADTSESLV